MGDFFSMVLYNIGLWTLLLHILKHGDPLIRHNNINYNYIIYYRNNTYSRYSAQNKISMSSRYTIRDLINKNILIFKKK